jgi:DNA-binding SARP family transcriptional activator/tetratricopeptide (TPR) repeat protein
MRFAILGPLEVSRDGEPVPTGGPQQRALLAALLLNHGRVVSVDRLVEYLWADEPPAAARSLVQGCVAGLRRALRTAGGDAAARLVTQPPGYLLRVAPGELDAAEFDELVARAEDLCRQQSRSALAEAGGLLHAALALWRGPVLDGVPLWGAGAGVVALSERRLAVLEQRIDVDLLLGGNPGLVGELRALVTEQPLRERLWVQLMVALAVSGRQADALAAFQELRRNLVDGLGVEPAAGVQRLHRAILAGGDALDAHLPTWRRPAADRAPADAPAAPGPAAALAAGVAVPAQLPPAVASFTGRGEHIERLDRILAETQDADQPPGIVVLAGAPGVGKTALALHWAHRVRDRFPDGALYVNLRGHASGPQLRPVDALAGFVQALGVAPERTPADADAAAALYRSLLAERRVLVVLDNASTAEQVRPLLPGTAGCLVLVTSRDRMRGLIAREGARTLPVTELPPAEARALLVRLLGTDRVGAAPAAAGELADACGRLPLAMRIAAATLAEAPWRGLAEYVADLMAGDRLDAFTVTEDGDYGVRSAFDLSYAELPEQARRMFRLLGLAPGPDLSRDGAAAVFGAAPGEVAPLLDRLVGAHLLTRTPGAAIDAGPRADRFTLHDLLRLYAVERGRAEDSDADRSAAAGRLHDWYLHSADAAARVLGPEKLRLIVPAPPADVRAAAFDGPTAALAWLDAERHNLRAAVHALASDARRASDTSRAATDAHRAALVSDALRGYYSHRMYTVDWIAVAGAAAAAARRAGHVPGEAAAMLSLADADSRRSRYGPAIGNYRAALALMERAGWVRGQAAVLGNLGVACRQAGRLADAEDYFARALARNARIGWVAGTAANLVVLGRVLLERGRFQDAEARHLEALRLFRDLGSRYGEAISLGALGESCHRLGRLTEAMDHLSSAVAKCRSVGDRGSEGDALRELACVHLELGHVARAEAMARRAVDLARESTDRRTEADTLNALGAVLHRMGRREAAIRTYREALRIARACQTDPPAAAALIGLATVLDDGTDRAPAVALLDEALDLARRGGYLVLTEAAQALLADDPAAIR